MSHASSELSRLEERLQHVFRDRELLERALTHKSHIYEKSPTGLVTGDNEQLEFLGDSILGFIVSEALVRLYPAYPEGRLSKLKGHLVSAVWLHQVAQQVGLGDFLVLGRGEEMSGGRGKRTLLSDAAEALIAALYIDGGIEAARRFIDAWVIGPALAAHTGEESPVTDFKSALQEVAQSRKLTPPRYVVVGEDGPEHVKVFTVEVRMGKDLTCRASGPSKKSAGQKAAQLLLERLNQEAAAEAPVPAGEIGGISFD
ncbi:MAG: ribonuclease III [Bryobacterales bacterium]|nr:ribonuclease III [Bryobacterales bacterium]MBV9399737.1 ribonuclease III [Bryobacterales bacterium]